MPTDLINQLKARIDQNLAPDNTLSVTSELISDTSISRLFGQALGNAGIKLSEVFVNVADQMITLSGKADLSGEKIPVQIQVTDIADNQQVKIEFPSEQSPPLGDLLRLFLRTNAQIPEGLTISEFISTSTNPQAFSVRFDQSWKMPFGPTYLNVNDAIITITLDDGRVTSLFHGILPLGAFDLNIRANLGGELDTGPDLQSILDNPINTIVSALQELAAPPEQIVEALIGLGLFPNEAALALNGLGMSHMDISRALSHSNVEPKEIVSSFVELYGANRDTASKAFEALAETDATVAQIAEWLLEFGVTIGSICRGGFDNLHAGIFDNEGQPQGWVVLYRSIAEALDRRGTDKDSLADYLKDDLDSNDYTHTMAAMGGSIADMTNGFLSAGYDIQNIVGRIDHVVYRWSMDVDESKYELVRTLHASGISVENIMKAFPHARPAELAGLMNALEQAPKDIVMFLFRNRRHYGPGSSLVQAAEAAEALVAIGVPLDQIINILLDLDYELDQIVKALGMPLVPVSDLEVARALHDGLDKSWSDTALLTQMILRGPPREQLVEILGTLGATSEQIEEALEFLG